MRRWLAGTGSALVLLVVAVVGFRLWLAGHDRRLRQDAAAHARADTLQARANQQHRIEQHWDTVFVRLHQALDTAKAEALAHPTVVTVTKLINSCDSTIAAKDSGKVAASRRADTLQTLVTILQHSTQRAPRWTLFAGAATPVVSNITNNRGALLIEAGSELRLVGQLHATARVEVAPAALGGNRLVVGGRYYFR